MPPTTYAVQTEKSSPRFARAFALGCGGIATASDCVQPGPVALFGSPARVSLLHDAIAQSRTWYYGDHGYFRRFQYFRVSKNAFQRQPSTWSTDDTRWKALHVNRAPAWQTGGRSIVICPNSPTYMRWFGIDADAWVARIVHRLHAISDRPIIVRWKTTASTRPLYVDLHDAYMVIAFSSASAVDALQAGVPICTLAPWATTAPLGLTDVDQINQPIFPPIELRDQFLFTLANQQWTLDELEAGVAWKVLRDE